MPKNKRKTELERVGLSEKMLLGGLTLLCLCALAFSVFFGLQSSREYGHSLDREHATAKRLDELQQDLTSQNAYLTALQTDKEFQKRVIRQKIGYAYPNERILHFARPQ